MTPSQPSPSLTYVQTALESAYAAVRTNHPDVMPAVIVVYKGSAHIRGHYAPMAWTLRAKKDHVDEIHVNAQLLREGGASVMQTLIHEGAHSLARALKIQEVSRANRYHNRQFRKLAEQMGLRYAQEHPDPIIGYSWCPITEETKDRYAAEIAAIDNHAELYPSGAILAPTAKTGTGQEGQDGNNGDDGEEATGKEKGRQLKAVCSCGRIIRTARKTFEEAPITCGKCRQPFQLQDRQ